MFSLDCNLMISDQIREQVVQYLESFSYQRIIKMTYRNDISKWHIKNIKDDEQRCQVERHYGVSKTSVTFRYQWKRLCDVLHWSVSLRYQLVRRYDVWNWSVLFTYQWDVTKTSQIGPSHWRTSCDVTMTSWHVRDVST